MILKQKYNKNIYFTFLIIYNIIFSFPSLSFLYQNHRYETKLFTNVARQTKKPTHPFHQNQDVNHLKKKYPYNLILFGGTGVTKDYQWLEEQFEIEITVRVPPNTKGQDILFKASPMSIDLKVIVDNNESDDDKKEIILLDGSRKMRGKLDMDGTYWSITDSNDSSEKHRLVTVTIEKYRTNEQVGNDMFGSAGDEDWGGVYPDDEEEVLERKYKEAEEMDVREYAKSLGVDIDNLNMSLVDKEMFSIANMTKGTMDNLKKGGYVKEITKQGNDEYYEGADGNAQPFVSPFGNMIDESQRVKIPFIDDDYNNNNLEDKSSLNDTTKNKSNSTTPLSSIKDKKTISYEEKNNDEENNVDPLDLLTVARLKEILREQKLKVSGTKQELRDRLRAHVDSLLSSIDGNDGDD